MDLLIFWDSGAPEGIEIPISHMVSDLLEVPSRVCANPIVLNGYVGVRRQTDATVVLDSIDLFKQRQGLQNHILLVTGNDLFSTHMTSLFGLARPSAGVAVVSTARLSNEFYGLMESEDDLVDRIIKEGAHEAGHLFGLDHCANMECIMHNPITLDDLDRKLRWFCPDCHDGLDRAKSLLCLT